MVLQEIKVDEQFILDVGRFRYYDKSKGLLEQCSGNVVLFAEKMLGFRLYSWQVHFLSKIMSSVNKEVDVREFLALTSRQIGKSTAVAIFCLWSAVFNKYPGTLYNNTIVGVVSASDVQSKKLLYEIKKFINLGDRVMSDYKDAGGTPLFGKEFFSSLLSPNDPNNTTTITFKAYDPEVHGKFVLFSSKHGSSIKSYPPTSSVLGETFTIVIEDEAGKSDCISDEFHYDYVYPTGNSTNAIRIYTSTPWSPSGFFYRLADPFDEYGDSSCERVLFTIDAIKLENPEYYKTVLKTIDQMNSDGKTNEVQRAYYCRFVKGEKNYFNPDRVFSCFTQDYDMVESFSRPCDLGVDFGGQVVSRTVVTITYLDEKGIIRRLYHKTYEVGEDDNLIQDITDLKKVFNVQRVIPDECPQGDYMIRKMIDLGWNVTPMNFRSEKVKKYGAFRTLLNKGKIKSYADNDLKTEMLSLEQQEGSRQSVIMHAPGYTDDLIDSFVLSAYHFLVEDNDFNFYSMLEEDEIDVYDSEKGFESKF